ncbi:MAG: sterol desaturase family protein [Alteraurantiacibacter sp.]
MTGDHSWGGAWDGLGTFLSDQALPVYVALLVLFAALELVLAKGPADGRARPAAPSRRYVVNFGLPIIAMVLFAALPLGSAGAALLAREHGWGLFHIVDAPAPLILMVALTLRTLALYWLHRIMHAVPVLWRIHRVHHTDPVLDVSTGLRHHPLEHLLGAPVALALVVALGLPLWAALLTDGVMLAGTLLKHLDGDLPPALERWVGLLLATPTIHRLHHSAAVAETDSNFGNLVIVWDRLFGTFTDPAHGSPARLGLGDRFDPGAHDLWQQLQVGLRDPQAPVKSAEDAV